MRVVIQKPAKEPVEWDDLEVRVSLATNPKGSPVVPEEIFTEWYVFCDYR
jgi:hypothetical protein